MNNKPAEDLLNENARLKQANNLLEQVFQNIGVGIRLIDANFNIIKFNDTYARMASLSNADLEAGQKCCNILNCALCGSEGCPLVRIIEGENFVEDECEKEYSDGKVIPYRVCGQPLLDSEGRITGAIELFTDITNSKVTQENLRRSENRFRLYFQSSPDGMAITDRSGRYLRVNPALCNLLRYSEPELMQLRVSDVDQSEHFNRLVETGVSRGEAELIRNGGSTVCVDIHAITLEDGCNLALIRDCTDRKEAERALIAEVELNTVLSELSHMFLSTTDVERIASVLLEKAVGLTDSRCGYNGYVESRTELFTISNWVGLCQLNRDDHVLNQFRGLCDWVLKHKKPLVINSPDIDYTAVGTTNGHISIYRFLSVPALIDGQLVGQITVVNSSRDYTERDLKTLQRLADIYAIALQRQQADQQIQESEQQYDLIINGINDAVMLFEVVDKKYFRFLKGNNTLFKMLGRLQEEIIGKFVQDVFSKEIANICIEHNMRATQSKEMKVTEVILPGIGTFETNYIPVLDNKGECSHLIVVTQDISERKKAEEHLSKMQKLESVGILAGGIAHDFNNILTAITGNVSLAKLRLANMNLESKEIILNLLGEAEKASLEARNLTQQLLTFAKGGTPILKTTSITELLKETAEFALRGSNVKCFFEIPENIWAVEVDEGQISQVIHNLIINADQAMPGGGKVEIKAENIVVTSEIKLPLQEGNYVKIAVSDNGVGIPSEFIDKIFDPYFSTKQRGSGLGLTTSYSIISKHGGLMEVQSEIGIGTRFQIYIPATEAAVGRKDKRNDTLTKGKGKVLVMDDEKMLRFMLGEMLQYLGYEVACAKDGNEAINIYSNAQNHKKPFDAVIMDLTIPGGMGGQETIKKLMEINPAVVAIVSSGYSNAPVMSEYEKYGFKDVVTKPYGVEELAEVLRKVINSHGETYKL